MINLSDLIQKILLENKKTQEADINNLSWNNDFVLNQNQKDNIKNKNIEVNKKNVINLKNNKSNSSFSPNKNIYSNFNINTLANMKENSNYKNFIANVTEKSQWSASQEEKISRSIEQSVYIEDKNKIKSKIKNYNLNSKSMNRLEYKKNIYNSGWNKTKSDARKNFFFNHMKKDMSLKKVKSNKAINTKTRNNPKNNYPFSENSLYTETNKNKEKNKESFINKNNKIYKIEDDNNANSNFRKSFQNLNSKNNNNNTNLNIRNPTNINNKKSLTVSNTNTNLESKNNIKTNDNNTTNKINDEVIKKLSLKERSYYILSNSPVLHLKERLYFARGTQNLRNIMPVSEILKKNEIFLNDKIKELEGRIAQCTKRINTVFNPSKTAEINFNFILSKDEDEFKKFIIIAENEKERNEFYNYVKIIYLIFNEDFNNIEDQNLIEKLYALIFTKGFRTIKDYLYDMFFKKKEISNVIINISKINSFLEEKKIDEKFNIKFCRFGLFTSFLIKEIIAYANEINNMIELKSKTKGFIEVINHKLKLYKSSNTLKKK